MQYGNTPYAARTRKWKLTENLTTTQEISYELYDLAADPREHADVHARFPEVVTHLRELIGRWKTAAGSRALGNRKMKLDPELLERLRELGYVDE